MQTIPIGPVLENSFTKTVNLSIVIVTWNVCADVMNCLRSLRTVQYDASYEIIIVDNASSDDTLALIRKEFPSARTIANPNNAGFARANNQGIAISSGEFVLLLNPDTIVPEGVLHTCVAAMRERPAVGALGCRLVYGDGRPQYECGRRFPRPSDLLWQAFYLHAFFPKSPQFNRQLMPEWRHDDDREVECLMGAFMLLRRSALDAVGLLDDSIFMYHEDVEMCHRLRKRGWKVWFLGSQSVVHLAGRSSAKSSRPLWLLEGEVKCHLMRTLYGDRMATACRAIIGLRSVMRLVIGLLLYVPVRLVGQSWREPDLFEPWRNVKLIHWSIDRRILSRYFPEIGQA